MEQLLAGLLLLLLIYFIIKVGRVLWRVLGVILLLFLIYLYKDQALVQINQFIADPNLGGIWQHVTQFMSNIWQMVSATI